MYMFLLGLAALAAAILPPPRSQNVLQLKTEANHTGTSPLTDEFDRLVHRVLHHFHVPGLSIAIVDGEKTYAKGYGFATLPDIKATPETLYYTASTTKSFTAAALSLVIDDSVNSSTKLSWKTRVSSIIRDDFVLADPYVTEHATFEDLASHRTGMPRHDDSYGGANFTLRDAVRNLRFLPLTAEFRTTFQYCNMMFMVLSYVIETITGVDLGEFMRTRIWKPLSMDHTYFSPADALSHENDTLLARGYYWDNDTCEYLVEQWPDEPYVSGAGNIISSVIDYSKYLRAMIHALPPMSSEWYHEMRNPRTVSEPNRGAGPQLYTLGWIYFTYRGEEIYAHDGAITGFGSIMAFSPNRNWGVAIFSNGGEGSGFVTSGLLSNLFDELFQVPALDRVDWITLFDGLIEEEKEEIKHSREELYPSVPSQPIALSLPLESYRGIYSHPAYQNISIELRAPSDRLPIHRVPDQVLYAHLRRSDVSGLYFEHVSGEHFLVWVVESDWANGTASGATRAEFVLGPDGLPARVGIDFEGRMRGEKIWFNRITCL